MIGSVRQGGSELRLERFDIGDIRRWSTGGLSGIKKTSISSLDVEVVELIANPTPEAGAENEVPVKAGIGSKNERDACSRNKEDWPSNSSKGGDGIVAVRIHPGDNNVESTTTFSELEELHLGNHDCAIHIALRPRTLEEINEALAAQERNMLCLRHHRHSHSEGHEVSYIRKEHRWIREEDIPNNEHYKGYEFPYPTIPPIDFNELDYLEYSFLFAHGDDGNDKVQQDHEAPTPPPLQQWQPQQQPALYASYFSVAPPSDMSPSTTYFSA
ncbi:hypothetical protein Scep_026253 [Stephania cephalantha]|uniref:Uncharacterized protein n=1 Tax=Stephania cephalantha TaxID=152367 RepID=A0AAP0HQ72_9MAGN